jgi:copper resistance protein C
MPRRPFRFLLAVLLLSSPTEPAFAHAQLISASPAADSMAMPAPRELQLKFTQDIVSDSSRVTMSGPDNKPISTGALKQTDGSTLIVPISGALSDGTYTVHWQVLCVDGEETEGSYKFESMK